MKHLWFFLALLASGSVASAQLQPTSLGQQGLSLDQMISTLVGRGVVITNATYTGAARASGIFCNGTDALGLESGILLTSGDVALSVGPNNQSGAGVTNGVPGDADLDTLIAVQDTADASVLEFDFIPVGPTVTFRYVFASEEYNEFVDSPFNDVFGFFVNGVNYALLPESATPVSINNVNNGYSTGLSTGPCQKCEFFIDNVDGAAGRNTQYDGLTTVLTFTAPVNPGVINHMKIAIADAGDSILDSAVFIDAGSFSSESLTTNYVTRNAAFWFSHPYAANTNCVNLRDAIQASLLFKCNAPSFDVGFMNLPSGFRNDDNVQDVEDAAIEALGLYWRKLKRTGDVGGTQSLGYPAARICQERKRLAIEIIAAQANANYLGTPPAVMTYFNGKAQVNFPATLISDAQSAGASDNMENMILHTALLRKFNSSGITNQFPEPLVECSPWSRAELKSLGRDPSTKNNCPGPNDTCESAVGLVFPNAQTNFFFAAKLKAGASLARMTDSLLSPSCGLGGANAVWKISPTVGADRRRFTVSTKGSNFDTLLSVLRGPCDSLAEIACNDNAIASTTGNSELSFLTDGTNTYYIVVEGVNGAIGKAKITVTSP